MEMTSNDKTERWYQALLEKDENYEGVFFVGVKSTGIFCRPGCPARKPKRSNTSFFQTTKEAMAHGFRPCKRCHPLKNRGETPPWIESLIREVECNPDHRITDAELERRNLSPLRLRRWFKQNRGMTFHAFQRSLALQNAQQNLLNGARISSVAYNHGYNSLSGFTDAYKRSTGNSPSTSKPCIYTHQLSTPLGPMIAGMYDHRLVMLEFKSDQRVERQLQRIGKELKTASIEGPGHLFQDVREQIAMYFQGQLSSFDLPIQMVGSTFQKKVWNALLEIPAATTQSYEDIARHINHARAVRAVGTANGANALAIVIPCHRVIGKSGKLTGYAGGLARKEWLLKHEEESFGSVKNLLKMDNS